MQRQQKIKILQALQAGDLQVSDLKPKEIFVFQQKDFGGSECFTMNGKTYTPDEVKEFCAANEKLNARRQAAGLDEDVVIIMKYERRQRPEPGEDIKIEVTME